MKVSELSGSALDLWVAKALDWTLTVDGFTYSVQQRHGVPIVQPAIARDDNGEFFEPSTLWAHGGPIIELERISVVNTGPNLWDAGWQRTGPYSLATFETPSGSGPHALVAAMRALVRRQYGDTVPDM